jgi:23S rRNA (adenine2503-C2)-methyltransferase
MASPPSALDLTWMDWQKVFDDNGINPSCLPFWISDLYKGQEMGQRHISASQLTELNSLYSLSLPTITRIQQSPDGVVKFQMRFTDSLEVETVLIPFFKRFTVCLSTQVGCGMGCNFCFTGTQGLKRHLLPGEIVGQYLVASEWLKNQRPQSLSPNIVFMGQGEPLHNVDGVKKAVQILNHKNMVDIGHRQMTLSTVGYLPGIKSLKEFPPINIALSLHSPFDEQRGQLIPINQRYPLSEVLEALDEITLLPRQYLTFEYLLLKNFNMSEDHAEALKNILSKRRALINLIPFNPFPGSPWERPAPAEIENFKQQLISRKLRVMVRGTKGDEILAACGQLKINEMMRSRK